MAPVGSWESLAAALDAGATSVYFGIEHLNMRARSSVNFTILGYLWFNATPSKLMMGDAGSRAMGLFISIAILKTGIEYSKRVADISNLYKKGKYKGKEADMKAAQAEFVDYIHRKAREPDSLVAFNPSGFGFYMPALRNYQHPTATPKK